MMRRMLILQALLLVLAILPLMSCCENEPRGGEYLSPDGKFKFVKFSRNCGATTGENFQVSVVPASAQFPTDAGNIFIADDNNGEADFVADVGWVGPHTLHITYAAKARVYKRESRVAGIDVNYIKHPPERWRQKLREDRLRWLSPEEGGRTEVPCGPTYSIVARLGETEEKWLRNARSVIIEFKATPDPGRFHLVQVRFLSNVGPLDILTPNRMFDLYEDRRNVSEGIVLSNSCS